MSGEHAIHIFDQSDDEVWVCTSYPSDQVTGAVKEQGRRDVEWNVVGFAVCPTVVGHFHYHLVRVGGVARS